MDLGYSITAKYPPDTDPSVAVSEVIRWARAADESGYEYVQTSDRHAVPDGLFLQNVPTAGRLAAEVDRLASFYPIPLYPPVYVAEIVGTLSAFVDRFDFWCSIGRWPEAFDAAGVALSERVPRFEEGLELIRRLWGEKSVTFDGDYYAVEDLSVSPTADPRVCIAGKAEPAVRRAGRMGDAWVVSAFQPMEVFTRALGWYRDAGGGDVIVRRDALVLEDGDRAETLVDELLSGGYRDLQSGTDALVVGDASDAGTALAELDAKGADDVVVRPILPKYAGETVRGIARARDLYL